MVCFVYGFRLTFALVLTIYHACFKAVPLNDKGMDKAGSLF